MAFPRSALEVLFDRLQHNQDQHIPGILQDAIDEYRELVSELERDERRKVNYIKSLIDYCISGKYGLAMNQLGIAKEEYYRYFFRRFRPGKLNKRAPVTMNFGRDSRKGSTSIKSVTLNERPRPASYTIIPKRVNVPRPNSEIVLPSIRKAGPATDLSDLSDAQKIAEKFGEIYRSEWLNALGELEHLRIYERNAITCLLRIVLDAYRVCVMEADTQITKLEDAAYHIMTEGTYKHGEKFIGHRPFLVEYRRGIADISLERLQESFRRRYLPEIVRSIGIYQYLRTHGPVHVYANQCVAICWAMAILDPQIHVVDDRDGQGLFSPELYTKYAKFGQSVAYYVWPPLCKGKGGNILTKGIAEGR